MDNIWFTQYSYVRVLMNWVYENLSIEYQGISGWRQAIIFKRVETGNSWTVFYGEHVHFLRLTMLSDQTNFKGF